MNGLCLCGCGQKTRISTMTRRARGITKGQPVRFIEGHQVKAEKNPRWNGGIRVTSEGYIQRQINASGQDAAYVLEHILIAEKALGRPLPEEAQVHHHNGNGADNRNQNLVICQDQTYHALLHQRQRAYSATGNPNSRKCQFCKEWGLDLTLAKNGNTFHRSCVNAYVASRRAKRKEANNVN